MRKISYGEGVERVFPLFADDRFHQDRAPRKVRRAKLITCARDAVRARISNVQTHHGAEEPPKPPQRIVGAHTHSGMHYGAAQAAPFSSPCAALDTGG